MTPARVAGRKTGASYQTSPSGPTLPQATAQLVSLSSSVLPPISRRPPKKTWTARYTSTGTSNTTERLSSSGRHSGMQGGSRDNEADLIASKESPAPSHSHQATQGTTQTECTTPVAKDLPVQNCGHITIRKKSRPGATEQSSSNSDTELDLPQDLEQDEPDSDQVPDSNTHLLDLQTGPGSHTIEAPVKRRLYQNDTSEPSHLQHERIVFSTEKTTGT